MKLYLFLIFPFSLMLFLRKNGFRFSLPVFFGIISALIVCGLNAFFINVTHVIEFSFSKYFFSYLIKQIMLPQIILYGLFFLFSRDSVDYKTKCFFPLIGAFFMVYMPFMLIKGHAVNYSFYELFCEPTLYLAMTATISVLLKNFSDVSDKKNLKIILSALIAIIYMIIPALIQTIYILAFNRILAGVLFGLYIAFPLCAYVLRIFFDVEFDFFRID